MTIVNIPLVALKFPEQFAFAKPHPVPGIKGVGQMYESKKSWNKTPYS